jgi:two-component sensor histidine kinase
LARVDHGTLDLREVVNMELEAHGDGYDKPGKVMIEGPSAMLPASSAQALALAIHELATNAIKYGALKQPEAKLGITWWVESSNGTGRRAVLRWRETGVHMPQGGERPVHKGYGSELIERALPYQLKAQTSLEFGPDGVSCRIATPIATEESSDE